MKIEEKTIILYHQILKTLTITIATTILFQNLKIIVMLLLVQAALERLFTCLKYLKKYVTKDQFI